MSSPKELKFPPELKEGTYFKVKGENELFVLRESNRRGKEFHPCAGCAFLLGKYFPRYCSLLLCSEDVRTDGKNLIVEKVKTRK